MTEDLARRFLIVDLDPQCEDPEARPFEHGFLDSVKYRRAELLSACLTILRWGRQNDASLKRGLPLGSFEQWAEWVRDPLLSLGCADPVQRIRDAKANDPRRRAVAELFAAWWNLHGSNPMKAAELDKSVLEILDPQGRGRQYVARRLMQMVGTRGEGFVLTYQPPARDGAKTGGTYALREGAQRLDGHPASQSPHSSVTEPSTASPGNRDELDASPQHAPERNRSHTGDRDELDARTQHAPQPGTSRTDNTDDLGARRPPSQTLTTGGRAAGGWNWLRMSNVGRDRS